MSTVKKIFDTNNESENKENYFFTKWRIQLH